MMGVFVCANSFVVLCAFYVLKANYEAKNEAKGGEAKNCRGKKKHLKKNTAFINEKAADKRDTPPPPRRRRRMMMMMMMVRE